MVLVSPEGKTGGVQPTPRFVSCLAGSGVLSCLSCLSAGGLYLILRGFLVCEQIIGQFSNFCYVISSFITGKAVSVSLLK